MFPFDFPPVWIEKSLPPPPAPRFFVLTSPDGTSSYGIALAFYQELKAKSICFLSPWPFYSQFISYLRQLLLLEIQDVEKSLLNIFYEVPIPVRGQLRVQFEINDTILTLDRPPIHEMPRYIDTTLLRYTLQVLNGRAIIDLLHFALLEQKILLISREPILLTAVSESIRALLFPFQWLHVYIPIVPEMLDLNYLVQAPVPFIAGISIQQFDAISVPENVVVVNIDTSTLKPRRSSFGLRLNDGSEVLLPLASQRVEKSVGKLCNEANKQDVYKELWENRLGKCGDGPSRIALTCCKRVIQMMTSLFAEYMKEEAKKKDMLDQDFFTRFKETACYIEFQRPRKMKSCFDNPEQELEVLFFDNLIHVGPMKALKSPEYTSYKTFVAMKPDFIPSVQKDDKKMSYIFPDLDTSKFRKPRQRPILQEDNSLEKYRNSAKSFKIAPERRSSEWFAQFVRDIRPIPRLKRSKTTGSNQDTHLIPKSNHLISDCGKCAPAVKKLDCMLNFLLVDPRSKLQDIVSVYISLSDLYIECNHIRQAISLYFEFTELSQVTDALGYRWRVLSYLIRTLCLHGDLVEALKLFGMQSDVFKDKSMTILSNKRFAAQVISSENQVLVEREYMTFSTGSLGMCLSSKKDGLGCIVGCFEDIQLDTKEKGPGPAESSGRIKKQDVIESINGENVTTWAFEKIVSLLRTATRPMTVTFLRGLERLEARKGTIMTRIQRDLTDRHGILMKYKIRISTIADCPLCLKKLSCSEIQAGWKRFDANDYQTTCPKCATRFVARICIRSNRRQDQIYEYISPNVLVKELESPIVPSTCIPNLRQAHPLLYWNMAVHFLMLDTPLDFLSLGESDFESERQPEIYGALKAGLDQFLQSDAGSDGCKIRQLAHSLAQTLTAFTE